MATTQSRGTPIDAGDFRGTRLSIMFIVTSSRGEGVEFLRRRKRRGRFKVPSKIVQRGTTSALDSFTLPHHTCDATPRLCGIIMNRHANPWVAPSSSQSSLSSLSHLLLYPLYPLYTRWGEWWLNDTHIFPLDALSFPPHLKVCLQGAGVNLI